MTYFIKTFGCQMNEADSEALAAVLEEQGYELAEKVEEADVVVVNSCSVRESAENRVFGLVNNLGQQENRPKIVLTGCMVGSATPDRRRYSLPQLKKRLPAVDHFIPNDTQQLPKLSTALRRTVEVPSYRPYTASSAVEGWVVGGRISATGSVPIMRGCDHFCSYCVVPYARGKEVSRPFDEVAEEVSQLARRGCKEVLLLGQNVNSYGRNSNVKAPPATPSDSEGGRGQNAKVQLKVKNLEKFKTPFALLLAVLHEIPGLEKISFLTSNPWDLTDDIIEAMSLPKIDRYLHLPVQSGDDEILKKMNRPYTVEEYLALVGKIRKRIPDIEIGTDLIVGFPGETKAQFENTVKLCREVGFVKAYISRYSPRPGTAAFRLKDDISPDEKRRRWWVLENLVNQNR
ncbi:MiaB/RimO family radical SAM methylthiotransferase [Candidatus Parcubacteria bacterium]|nr:MiaB/RimO family radical SAM methylthiotransferase [Candidatus Parcubacteria bacterium]